MIFETDEETRDFKTVYVKDFYPKKGKKQNPILPPVNFNPPLNVLNEPFKEHINTQRVNKKLPESEQTEDPQEYLDKIHRRYPHLNNFLPKIIPNEDLLELEQRKSMMTLYRVHFSKHIDDYLSLRARRLGGDRQPVTLPENWSIPETIQRRSYRNPRDLAPESQLIRTRCPKHSNNLDPNLEERRILRVRTGISEYEGTVGAIGNRVLKEQLFGPPLPLEPPLLHVKRSGRTKSECSMILLNTKRPFLSNVM